MVARTAPGAPAYVPGEGSRLAISADGSLAAVVERAGLVVVELPSGAPFLELARDPAATAVDVGWVGVPPRLLVLARFADHTRVSLLDSDGRPGEEPTRIAELRLDGSMHLGPTVGTRALATGTAGAVVLGASDTQLVQAGMSMPTRPLATGAAGAHIMIALESSIEEWDLQSRMPTRRFRLPRAGVISAIGGSERVVWCTSQHEPSRIDVLPLVNRAQPKLHQLPEPMREISGHPRSDVIVGVGATTRRIYVIDLDGRTPMRVLTPDGLDRPTAAALVVGRGVGVLVAQPGSPLAFIPLDDRDREDSAAARGTVSAARIPVPTLASRRAEPPAHEPDDSAYPPVAPPQPRPAPSPAMTPELACLAPRSSPRRCSAGEYLVMLELLRRAVSAVAVLAIARDWDSGRLAFNSQDRPPFEAEVLSITGRRAALATSHVVEASEAAEQALDELRAMRSSLAGRLTPIEAICAEHGISKAGEQVLLFVAAPSLWGELARLYGILANDPARGTCDEHLLWQLLRDTMTRQELARELDPGGPLVGQGLIRAGERPRPFQQLTADATAIKLLSGSSGVEDAIRGVERVPAVVDLDQFRAPRVVIDRALADLAIAPAGAARVVVRGRTGSGRRTLLATFAQLAGRTLATIDAAMLIREKQIAGLASLLQHVNLRGWLPCVDGLDTIPSDDAITRGMVREQLRDHPGPLAIRLPHHAHPPLEPGYVSIDIPISSVTDRAQQWIAALSGRGLAVRDPDSLAARFTVGAGTIHRVVESVARAAPKDVDRAVDDTMRQHLETKLGEVAKRVTRLANWSQIVLPADIHDSIVELIARVRHRRTVYDTWGFDQVMSTSRGLTALFQGGPGTGKTLVAGAIANELGLDLYRIDLSRVMSKWIGETEQNLAKVFDAAEEGQALILFDEADSLFAKRTEVRTSVDRYANLEVNYLLQRLDTFEGVAILTTNHGTSIDAAFKRRLSCRLTFPFPDDDAREELWRVHIPSQVPIAGRLDLAGLAKRYKMSGGYIRNAALRAAFLAAEEQSPLTQDHLERAVRAEFREGGKLAESGMLE